MNSIQSKIERIKRSPGRSTDYGLKSHTSFIDKYICDDIVLIKKGMKDRLKITT